MTLLKLFWTLLYVNTFTIGGGYVMLPILHKEVVERYGWLTDKEFMEAIAAGQLTPGPLTIMNAFIGYKVSGIAGSVVAVAGSYLPSVIIVTIASRYYIEFKSNRAVNSAFRGIMPAVIGLLAAVALKLGAVSVVDIPTGAIALGSFCLIAFTRTDPTFVIMGSAVAAMALYR